MSAKAIDVNQNNLNINRKRKERFFCRIKLP